QKPARGRAFLLAGAAKFLRLPPAYSIRFGRMFASLKPCLIYRRYSVGLLFPDIPFYRLAKLVAQRFTASD
ncbi:hypothetical protein MLK78_26640, partial [Escherichia coli]|nr:hypothetical protein [Escherichia coli]